MRMGVLEHLGIAQAPAWLFAAELREGTVIRLLTQFERKRPTNPWLNGVTRPSGRG